MTKVSEDGLVSAIELGDRNAMAMYLANALNQDVSEEERLRRFKVVLKSDHGYDSMVMRNLGMVAGQAGEHGYALSFARDLKDSRFYQDALSILIVNYRSENSEVREKSLCEIKDLAALGHIKSQLFVHNLQNKNSTGFLRLREKIFRLRKSVLAIYLAGRNKEDPRIQM